MDRGRVNSINSGGEKMYTADQICNMIDFLVKHIFIQFGGCLFRQIIGIPMGTNCTPLLADLFLYSYESEFLGSLVRSGHRGLARSFNVWYRYTDDLIVFSNKKFMDCVKDIYPSELNVEKANRLDDQANYLYFTFIIGNNNKLYTKLYDKHDDFTLSTFRSCQVTYRLALHMVFTFRSLSDMQDAAHIMMTLDISINSWWTDSFLRAMKQPTEKFFPKMLWQVSRFGCKVSEVC